MPASYTAMLFVIAGSRNIPFPGGKSLETGNSAVIKPVGLHSWDVLAKIVLTNGYNDSKYETTIPY